MIEEKYATAKSEIRNRYEYSHIKQPSTNKLTRNENSKNEEHEDLLELSGYVGELRAEEKQPSSPVPGWLKDAWDSDDDLSNAVGKGAQTQEEDFEVQSPSYVPYPELENVVASNGGGVPDVATKTKSPGSQNPLQKEAEGIFGKYKNFPRQDEVGYPEFSWELEKFAQKHHSKQDLDNFRKLKDEYRKDLEALANPDNRNSRGNSGQNANQTDGKKNIGELRKLMQGMDRLEEKMADYNLDNYDPEKVKNVKGAVDEYEKLSRTDPSKADKKLDEFLRKNANDSDAKKILKTLCYDEKDKKVGEKIFEKAAYVEAEEIFKNLKETLPWDNMAIKGTKGYRGECGSCADQVEDELKKMDLQFHSFQRIQGYIPTPHIATELIENKFDNSQKVGAKDNIVLDMWLKGLNAGSGFGDLDYNDFRDSNPLSAGLNRLRQAEAGVYPRSGWPAPFSHPIDGSHGTKK